MSTFPVTKNGVFLGYADARQIAENPCLTIYDERKAQANEAERAVEAEKSKRAEETKKVEAAAQSGGADASAVKKGPAK